MKIHVFGAGVIGCIYAVKFSNAGHDVYVYARRSRLIPAFAGAGGKIENDVLHFA